jgi:hypothetical protein
MAQRFTTLIVAGAAVIACLALQAGMADAVSVDMCSGFTGPDCGGAAGDIACLDDMGMPDPLQDCFDTGGGCQCRPRVCCTCESVSGGSDSACTQPCTETGLGLLVCVGLCAIVNDPPDDACNLQIVNESTCADGACPTTGCCTFNESQQARTVSGSICVETDEDTCGLLGDLTLFIPDGSCDGGLLGQCVSPTPTATPTNTATATGTATNTATPSQTPTNTLAPNGGECATPSQCSSMFCVDGVCCNTICDQPLEVCNDPANPGVCSLLTAPAPAMSGTGLLMALLALAIIGTFALMWRQRRS